MNVFVLCTGRCGSVTFIEACKHIINYSSAHESRASHIGVERMNYPEHHIEADNRLSWLLGRLEKVYGEHAFYVHLKRNREATAESFIKRYDRGIMKAYRGNGIIMGLPENSNPLDVALDYCDTVNANIDAFLKDKPLKMDFQIESATQDFKIFCKHINAKLDMERALSEFSIHHNASTQSKPSLFKSIFSR